MPRVGYNCTSAISIPGSGTTSTREVTTMKIQENFYIANFFLLHVNVLDELY